MQSERISTESIISELFSNTENSKIFKKIPQHVIGATNVYLIKLNYNYSNQNKFSYLNGCVFKCDSEPEDVTEDDIKIIINVLPSIKYSSEINTETKAKYQFKYYDGTWFRLYWNQYLQQWKFSTSQLVNGEISTWNNVNIGELFEKYVQNIDTSNLNIDNTYFFIYSHPMVTYDPSAIEEHIQYITSVTKDGNFDFNEYFPRNNEEIDETCNIIQLYDNEINIVVQNEMYANIKQHFRTDLNTIFLNFYAKPTENMHVMKLFFDSCPRFVNMYNDFINNPLLEGLVNSIANFTTKNIYKYFNKMNVTINKIDSNIFTIWCSLLMRIDPSYKWNHNDTPFNNFKNLNIKCIEVLTNPIYVKECLCDIPINYIMNVIN